jgi:hypothetical protein
MKPFNLRPLLWFDCVAAAIGGTAMLALAGLLAPLFGLSRAVVVFVGLVNLAYGAFSFSLARQPSPARGRARALVTANLLWVAVCLVMGKAKMTLSIWRANANIRAEEISSYH